MNAREAIPCQTLLNKLGHKQPPTPIQTDNSTAVGVVTHNILPRCTKAMVCISGGSATANHKTNSVTTGAQDLPIAVTTSQSTTALSATPSKYLSS